MFPGEILPERDVAKGCKLNRSGLDGTNAERPELGKRSEACLHHRDGCSGVRRCRGQRNDYRQILPADFIVFIVIFDAYDFC